jgi:sulfate transport system permease protein
MSSAAPPSEAVTARGWSLGRRLGGGLGLGVATLYLSVIVLLPLAALAWRSVSDGGGSFWSAISSPESLSALELTCLVSLAVTAINAVMGTLVAWVLVRDRFPGRTLVNGLIDLPFALPTIVAGLTLLALYGTGSPLGVDVAYTRWAIGIALLFVTLPFVVRAVQPLLMEMDREMEEAAATLGAGRLAIFFRVILPNLAPGIIAGVGLGFARALGEFGSVVLISGNIPFKTEVSAVDIFGLIENDAPGDAAAVSILLLAVSFAALLLLALLGRVLGKHER